jgi:NAD(P)H-hydrate epimerase
LLLVGGDKGWSGAIRMAGEAALRVGAGLVSIATHPDHAAFLNLTRPELMCHGVRTAKDIQSLLKKATILVLGPGLGQSAWSKKIFLASIKAKLPKVLDADALNLLAKHQLKIQNAILTPHPGEAARLLKTDTAEIQRDRLLSVKKLQKKWDNICVLKGAGTLISTAPGDVAICNLGNPGMATAGMGDILSGVIGGLLSQGMTKTAAAKLGVCVHAMAGDLAAKNGERGMIATDLFPFLRQLMNSQ